MTIAGLRDDDITKRAEWREKSSAVPATPR